MTSSTSSSELLLQPPPRTRRHRRAHLHHLLLGLATFALLALAGTWVTKLPAYQPHRPLIVDAAVPPSPLWYLSYNRAAVDEYVIYHNLNDSIQPAKEADVLFVGNSRVMFAFPHNTLATFFRKMKLRYFVLAFPYGEGSTFAEALIKKHDLRPKWLIINADPFFKDKTSAFATKVMADSPWDAWKFKLEADAAFAVRRRLHQYVPRYDPTAPERDWILFKSYQDGTTRVAAANLQLDPARYTRKARQAYATDETLAIARRFIDDMRSRGSNVILTAVPPKSYNPALDIAQANNLPMLLPRVRNLETLDGGHLTPDSAHRYSNAFLADLQKLLKGQSLPLPPRLPAPRATTQPTQPDDDDDDHPL